MKQEKGSAAKFCEQFQPVIVELLKRAKGMQENGQRQSYAPWFKELVYNALDNLSDEFGYLEVSNLTGISVRTLENFKQHIEKLKLEKKEITDLHALIEEAWELATAAEKKT